MRFDRKWPAWLMLGVLAGCTHLETLPDTTMTPPGQASRGSEYALPMLQYSVAVTRSLRHCPEQATIKGIPGTPGLTLTNPNLAFQVKVEPTARYIPGERYVVDHEALSTFLKTTSYGFETYPSGTLKSINVSADDHTGEVIKDTVGTALVVASLAGGAPVAATAFAGALTASSGQANGGSRRVAGRGRRPGKTSTQESRNYAAALSALDALAPLHPVVMCTPEAAEWLAASAANGDAQDEVVADLKKATKAVESLTVVANLRRARAEDVQALAAAFERQDGLTLKLSDLQDERSTLDGNVSTKTTSSWPSRPIEDAYVLPMGGPSAKLQGLLEIRQARTIDAAQLVEWFKRQTPSMQATAWKYLEPLLKLYIRKDGSVIARQPSPATACNSPSPSISECVNSEASVSIDLVRAEGTPTPCLGRPGSPSGCLPVVSVDEKRRTGRIATDSIPDQGLFIRSPAEAFLLSCRQSTVPVDGQCDAGRELSRGDKVSAPQLGQLRFLPFGSDAFEANSLSLSLREDGSISTFTYAKTRAAGTGAAAAARDAVTQYKDFRDSEDAKRATQLTAARAEAIAKLQFEIDTLTKQADILKLRTPATSDEAAAINEEIARIDRETALLNSRLSHMKAEAAVAEQAAAT